MPDTIDLVADLGESFGSYRIGDDASLLEVVSSANVACGFHAGDPRVIDTTVKRCASLGVALGAHPGFPDLVGFGRRIIEMTRAEVAADVLYQLGALSAFARRHGTVVEHVSPHGALGNLCVIDCEYAHGVVDAIIDFDAKLLVLAQPGELLRVAEERGLRTAALAFADRGYNPDGSLVSRRLPGAIIDNAEQVAERAVQMATAHAVRAIDGSTLEIRCDAVLLHGDSPGAVELAHAVRGALEAANLGIRSCVPGPTPL